MSWLSIESISFRFMSFRNSVGALRFLNFNYVPFSFFLPVLLFIYKFAKVTPYGDEDED